MDMPVADPVATPEPSVTPAASNDPFALDESKLVSLSPEQRAALDPVIEEWKTRAKTEMEKSGKTYEEKFKPHLEKSQALDQLVKDPRFVQWWQGIQSTAANQNPQGQQAISQARPQDFASADEWTQAVSEAYSGDGRKLQEIQARMFSIMATPVIQQLRQGQDELKATIEVKDLFERHPDAKELDSIGRSGEAGDQGQSLLEMCLEWAEKNGKSFEDGYQKARSWADALKVGAQKEAMGLIDGKKASITSGPSTNKGGSPVVEVADADELMTKNMEYIASGQKPPKFVIRPKGSPSGTQWAQRT